MAYNDDEFEAIARQVELIGQRLSVPIQPRGEEGIAEVLFRAACENGFRKTSTFAGILGLGRREMTPQSLAREHLDATRLADFLGTRTRTDVESVIYPKLDRFGNRIRFFGRDVALKGFFTSHRRIAPRSLADNLTLKAVWGVAGLSFDPDTRETLLTRCPECGERASYTIGIALELCPGCYRKEVLVDFRKYPQPIAEADDNEALDFALALINPRLSIEQLDFNILHACLAGHGPGELFQLISHMAVAWENSLNTAWLVSPAAQALATASRAILDWPYGMGRFSEAIIRRNPMRQDPSTLAYAVCQSVGRDLRIRVLGAFQAGRRSRK